MYRERITDVLIIGGGGAAGRAAIAASDAGASTLMVLKKRLCASGATTHKCCEMAGFNVPGCVDNGDDEEHYLDDMMQAALGMADRRLSAILAENVGERFNDLLSWGVTPAQENGRNVIMKGCYSNYRRTFTIKGHGEPIMQALAGQIRKRPITVMEDAFAIDLIVRDGRCRGAVVLDENNEFVVIHAGAVILATGGASQVFLNNLNPDDVTGDGYSMAYDNGAALMNMEFMQAGIGFFHPIKSLFNTYLWAGFPELSNRNGEQFLQKYLPEGLSVQDVMLEHCKHFPFSSKDISRFLEIGIQKEIEAGGGTERMCIPVSFSHFSREYIQNLSFDADLKQMWPMVLEHFEKNGVNIREDSIEITCIAQAVNGGIKIDENAMSTVPGLFAAGETAAGPHGADRLGGNMMGTCQVFGQIAGKNAASYAAENPARRVDVDPEMLWAVALLRKKVDAAQLTLRLQKAAQTRLFICRTEEKLLKMQQEAEELLSILEQSESGNSLNRKNLELYFRINSCLVMTRAALNRRESRGSHYREDYPERNDEQFGAPIVLRKGDTL